MVEKMKVLALQAPLSDLYLGGAELQARNTIHALEKKIDVVSSLTQIKDISEIDVVHFFRLHSGFWEFSEFLKTRKIPFVISPIYYPSKSIIRQSLRVISKLNFRSASHLTNAGRRINFLKDATAVFPNTFDEEKFISGLIKDTIIHRIPNCVDDEYYDLLTTSMSDDNTLKRLPGTVLCVGRIEQRKGQLPLLKACRELGLSLTTIGSIRDQDMFNEMSKLNYHKWEHIPFENDRNRLLKQYLKHEIYAQPSLMETPGLASMEALLAGCKLISCRAGGTFEYFANNAFYLKSQDASEISVALQNALEQKSPTEQIKFTRYDDIADEYIRCYNQVINHYC